MTAAVQVIPITTGSAQPGSCQLYGDRCELFTGGGPDGTFSVVVHGISLPQTAGATLGISVSAPMGGGLTLTGATLPTTLPTSGLPFATLVATPTTSSNCAGSNCIVTAIAPLVGTLPSGTVDAFVLHFSVNPSGCVSGPPFYPACVYLIDIYDDGEDFAWTAADSSTIPMSYTQARVDYCPFALECTRAVIPIPASAGLLVSSLALLFGLPVAGSRTRWQRSTRISTARRERQHDCDLQPTAW